MLADCYRALSAGSRSTTLWEELREASPSAELVAEGRIVVAGALADRGDSPVRSTCSRRPTADPKRPRQHHLRLWYALADLHERAGDLPRARSCSAGSSPTTPTSSTCATAPARSAEKPRHPLDTLASTASPG